MKSPFYATVPNTTALVFTFEIKDMYCSKVLFYIIIYYYKYVIIIKKKTKYIKHLCERKKQNGSECKINQEQSAYFSIHCENVKCYPAVK